MPAFLLNGRHDPFLEVRQGFPIFQGFLYAVAHKLDQVLFGQPRNVERPVFGLFAQSLGLFVRQFRPLLPERYGRVRGDGLRDDFPRGQLNGLFSHLHPSPSPFRRLKENAVQASASSSASAATAEAPWPAAAVMARARKLSRASGAMDGESNAARASSSSS